MRRVRLLFALAITGVFFATTAGAVTFEVDKTKMNIGGYTKLDVQYADPGLSGSGTVYGLGQMPSKDSKRDATLDITARESRLWFKTATETDAGTIKVHIEGDFYGDDKGTNEVATNSSGFRLRHAYGAFNGWLLGQTWTTFMDLGSLSELLDFGQHRSVVFIRQAQIRYTHQLSNGSLMFSLENPENFITDPDTGAPVGSGFDNNNVPDVVARWVRKGEKWHTSLGLLGRQFKIDDSAGNTDEEFAFAGSFSGKVMLTENDDVRFQINGGALGRYVGLVAHPGATYDGSKLEALDSYGGSVAFQHKWSPTLRSTLVLSGTEADVATDSALFESTRSGHLNLLWDVAKPLRLGVELALIEGDAANGDGVELNRVICSARYVF